MVIFHSYVSLPEGSGWEQASHFLGHDVIPLSNGNQCSPVILHGVPVTMILSDLVPSACPVTIHLTNLSEKRDFWGGFQKMGGSEVQVPKFSKSSFVQETIVVKWSNDPPIFWGKQHFPRQESSNLSDFGNSCWYSQVNPGNVGITGNEIQPLVGRSQNILTISSSKFGSIWVNVGSKLYFQRCSKTLESKSSIKYGVLFQ